MGSSRCPPATPPPTRGVPGGDGEREGFSGSVHTRTSTRLPSSLCVRSAESMSGSCSNGVTCSPLGVSPLLSRTGMCAHATTSSEPTAAPPPYPSSLITCAACSSSTSLVAAVTCTPRRETRARHLYLAAPPRSCDEGSMSGPRDRSGAPETSSDGSWPSYSAATSRAGESFRSIGPAPSIITRTVTRGKSRPSPRRSRSRESSVMYESESEPYAEPESLPDPYE